MNQTILISCTTQRMYVCMCLYACYTMQMEREKSKRGENKTETARVQTLRARETKILRVRR